MFDLEPGPLARLEPDQVRPFPSRASFEGLVAEALGELPALDARLAGAAVATTDNPSLDLDAVFTTTIGGAAAEVDNQLAGAPVSPAAQLVGAGDNADGLRQDSLRYLPSADTPIRATLEDPPGPPGTIGYGAFPNPEPTTKGPRID